MPEFRISRRSLVTIAALVNAACHTGQAPGAPTAGGKGVQTAGHELSVDGRSLHPACLYELHVQLADPRPVATAVDVDGCARSNAYTGAVSVEDGWTVYRDEELLGRAGWFRYRRAGTTSRGIHVVEIADGGGGTGVFQDLLFVRLRRQRWWTEWAWTERWIAECVGRAAIGDRTGYRVEVEGDKVMLHRRGEEAETIDLSGG